MLTVGYVRVSSAEQNLARQIKVLEAFGCDQIISEKQSGKDFAGRPKYNEMIKTLRLNDILVVHDLSRFRRNKQEIKEEWENLTKKVLI